MESSIIVRGFIRFPIHGTKKKEKKSVSCVFDVRVEMRDCEEHAVMEVKLPVITCFISLYMLIPLKLCIYAAICSTHQYL